jgi:2-polyprenyl-3-methyl-5-hydroxy-6-metoxy-1,4-benzoquinol methylase
MNLLKKRNLRPEIMDDPELAESSHFHALNGLHRINLLSGAAAQTFNALKEFQSSRKTPLRVLDIATGGGDIPRYLARKAQNSGLPFDISACDKSEAALSYACERAKRAGLRVNYFPLDIFRDPIPCSYDVIISSLFLHHLPILQTYSFLKKIASAARKGIILNDLRRCWPGYLLASSIPLILTSSKIVHEDGIQSVRAAYSLREIKRIVQRSGLSKSEVHKTWPFRYQILWRRM